MKTLAFDFYGQKRQRNIPVLVYLPKNHTNSLPTVVFGPGYQGQRDLQREELVYKRYVYLAEYFTSKGYAFITIQHDILGDNDGLETIDPQAVQDEARRHLYKRGEANILFVIESLGEQGLSLNLDNFILSGHSNGGDIAKYFANTHPSRVHSLILFDARRARFLPQIPLKVLMFEADDTTTDLGAIPEPIQEDNSMRSNLDLTIIKPQGALHISYMDEYVSDELKRKIFSSLDWFLSQPSIDNRERR